MFRDKAVILCVVFNYNVFIGLKLYNIDKNSFIDVFKDELYLYDIWGLSEETKKYLYKYKKLKEEPIFYKGINYETDAFHCQTGFIGYRDLPQLDIGFGIIVNGNNQVISHILIENSKKSFNLVDYRNRYIGTFEGKTILNYRRYGLKITNLTEDNSKIVPLNLPFYKKVDSDSNNLSLGKFEEDDSYEKLTFQQKENNKKYRRKIDLILMDGINSSQNIKEKELIQDIYLNFSNDIYKILVGKGYRDVFQNKEPLNRIAQFINTEKLLDEFDDLKNAPCGDESCTFFINTIKQKTKDLGSYSGRKSEVAGLFLELEKNGTFVFKKNLCKSCYTMLNIYGLAYIENNDRINGFSPNNFYMPNSIFVDITDKYMFSLVSIKTLIHEFIHNLSKKEIKDSKGVKIISGINKNTDYSMVYRVLNEGVTELLTCYFLYNDLRVRNKDKISLEYKGKYLDFVDYQSKLNPYLKLLNSFYPEVDSILNTSGMADKRIFRSYTYNIYLVLQIMKDIGIEEVINSYLYADVDTFEILCRMFYKENWDAFLDSFKGNSASLSKEEYEKMKQFLVKG